MKKLFSVLLFNLIVMSFIYAETPIGPGFVHGIWTVSNSPYEINGEITIPNDSTLTIEPGVIVEFQGHYALQVQGRLIAIGTEADSIMFSIADTTGFNRTDTTLGGWFGIRFIDTPTTNDSSKLEYCRLEYGKAVADFWPDNSGGALCVLAYSKISISHCLFINNLAGGLEEATPSGGAIHITWSDIVMKESIVSNNRATWGGGIHYYETKVTFINTTFSYNTARDGAAIANNENCFSIFTDCNIVNNFCTGSGGGVNFGYHSYSVFNRVTFSGNTGTNGGGIHDGYGDLQLADCIFENNSVTNIGAGMSFDSCHVDIDNCTFRNNNGDIWAGGIHSSTSDLTVTDCLFEENSAGDLGGGIHADITRLLVKNTIFRGNGADLSGGIHSWYTDLTVRNCTFKENTAVSSGAGIHGDFSHIVIDSTTFSANQAAWGAGVQVYNSDLEIDSCQFRENMAIDGQSGAVDFWADSTVFDDLFQFNVERSLFVGNSATTNTAGVRIEQVNSDTSLIDVVVDQCIFTDNHSDIYCPFRMTGNITDFSITNCVFSHNTSQRYVAGPGFTSGSKGCIYNCVFASNYAVYTDSTANSSCASLGNGAEIDFINCTFVDTSDVLGYGVSVHNGSRAILTNTIIWGCGNRPINPLSNTEIGSEVTINYCAIENGQDSVYVTDTVSTVSWGSGNLAVDPQFVDWENADFHLQDSSPLIGAGINCLMINDVQYCAPDHDIEGVERPSPQGSNTDIGAYEHNLGEPLAINMLRRKLPQSFKLGQNYPNPFNPVTMINYQLPITSYVEISIYNILGQKVTTLVSEKQDAGYYQVEWNATEFASSVYYYRIKAGKYQDVKKMVLIK